MATSLKKPKPKSKARKSPAPGPQIVRAWFDTVINPLLKGLAKENSLVIRIAWTWRFRIGALESIQPARHYIPAEACENLEQFVDFHPRVKTRIGRHDHEVEALTAACFRLHNTLVNQSALPGLYQELTTLDALRPVASQSRYRGVPIENVTAEQLVAEYFGGYPPSDHIAVLAEYIINNTGELPDHYTTAPFWNRYRERFMTALQAPKVAAQYRETTGVGARLRQVSNELSETLDQIRRKLSVDHDVPYVDPGSIRRADWQ